MRNDSIATPEWNLRMWRLYYQNWRKWHILLYLRNTVCILFNKYWELSHHWCWWDNSILYSAVRLAHCIHPLPDGSIWFTEAFELSMVRAFRQHPTWTIELNAICCFLINMKQINIHVLAIIFLFHRSFCEKYWTAKAHTCTTAFTAPLFFWLHWDFK